MTRWTIVPLQGSLGEYAAAWDSLNAREFGDHPMLSSMFVNGLLQNFGSGAEYLCLLEAAGQIEAMCLLQQRSKLVWTSFLPSQGQIGPTLIRDGATVPSLLQSLPRGVTQLDLLCNDPEVGGVVNSAQPPTQRMNHALTIRVDLVGTFDAYWADRSRRLQSNLRRYEKRLLADGLADRFVRTTSPAEMVAAVDRYVALETAGWKGRNGTALGSSVAQQRFYRDLMLRAAEEGNASVQELWFGDQLAASRLVLSAQDKQVFLKTTFDERFAAYAPGRLLLRHVIQQAFSAHPGGVLEFYTDANADQLAWATAQRRIQHASYYRWPFLKDMVRAVRGFRGPRRLKTGVRSGHTDVFRVDVYRHPDDLPAQVQALLREAEGRNIGFGGDWYRNLIKTVYPNDPGVRFYTLHKNDKAIAVLPLRATKAGAGLNVNALSNFYTTLYQPILDQTIKSVDLVEILSQVQKDFPRFAALNLSPMDPGSDAYQTLLGAMRIWGWLPFEYFAFGNWYQTCTGTWNDYLVGRHGTLRSTIKRMTKKFAADGGLLQIVTDPKDIAVGIAAYSEVYAASWKRPEEFPEFMPGLLNYCADKGYLRLGLAWLDGKPIAAQVWIVAHGRAEIYKVAYHERFKAYAPGTLVTALLMKHAFDEDQVGEVDYLIGDDAYKKTWMSHRRERWGIIAYNPRSLGGLFGFAREALGRTLKGWANHLRPRGMAESPMRAAGK
jgi:CelD/BcsL family acetyltransferase involved in cellulose biosynthesis